MSTLKVDAIVDSSAGNTTTINGATPTAYNTMGKNLVINGAMDIAQRATSYATGVNTGYTLLDRWKTGGSGNVGQWTISQDTDAPAGFAKSFKIECTTSDTSLASGDHYGFQQKIEGNYLSSVGKGTSGAKPLTLSLYLKANVIKTFGVELTDAGNSRHVSFNATPSATNTWERFTFSIPADTSGGFNAGTTNTGSELNIWFGAGTTYTSGSTQANWVARSGGNIMPGTSNWADTVGNTIWITGVQLEVGSVSTEFERRPYGTELALCQRYYYQQNWTDGYQQILDPCRVGQTNQVSGIFKLPVTMRTRPSFSHNGVGNFRVNHTNSGGTINDEVCNQIQVNSTTTESISLNFYKPTSNMTRGDTGYVNCEANNDASIYVSAEL